MDATLTKTQRVLKLVQPNEFGINGQRMTFTDGDSLQREPGVAVQISWALWTELGRPDDITVTIRPDDTLN